MIRIRLLLVLCAMLCSCSSTQFKNLQPTYLMGDPSVTSYKDPSVDYSRYRTFSVIPFNEVNSSVHQDPIAEKQVLFFIRNCLELKGYTFVQDRSQADIVVTSSFSTEYKEFYVPPSTVTLPQYVPGRTITRTTNEHGTANASIYGDVSAYGWGSYSGQSTESIRVPGYVTSQTYERPGYNYGQYFPATGIYIYDANSGEQIWRGSGAGISDKSDFRICGQLVLLSVMGKFPSPRFASPNSSDINAYYGITIFPMTVDGNSFFPAILEIDPRSPAQRAGIMEEDFIVGIDGHSTENMPFSEVSLLLNGGVGTQTTFTIWRSGKSIEITVKKGLRPRT